MKLITGLGNIGSQYESTRHNAGFMAIDACAQLYGMHFSSKTSFYGDIASGTIIGSGSAEKIRLLLLKPSTYMNLSGRSAQLVLSYHKLSPTDLVVIHDDIELEFGKIKYKLGGGHGGHNGLKSIDQSIGTRDYHRVRIGVGRPNGSDIDVSDYVLSKFALGEYQQLKDKFTKLAEILPLLLSGDIIKFQASIGSL